MQELDGLNAYHAKQDFIQKKVKVSVKYVVLVNIVILLHQVNVWFVQQANMQDLDHLHAHHVMQDIIQEKEHWSVKCVELVHIVTLLHQVNA